MTETLPIDPVVPPSGTGCVECLDGRGHVGCCDSSPGQHASAHADATGHRVVQSFEPGEDWFWDYAAADFYDGPALAAPVDRPHDQPVPGPAGAVPPDWQQHLH